MQYNYSQEQLEKKKKDLLDTVNGLNDEYDALLPSLKNTNENGFTFMEKDTTSDETLKNRAETQANAEFETKKAKAEEDTSQKTSSLEKSIKELLEGAESKKQDTSDSYELSKKRVEEDASKRGIARSSIANGSIADLEGKKLAALSKIDDDTAAKSDDIQLQITELKNKLSELISLYEMQKAASAESLFSTAKAARDKSNADADKYNNSLRQFEIQNGVNTSNTAAEQAKVDYDKKKIAAVVDFYNSFADKNKAIEDFLSNEDLKMALGETYDVCLRLIYSS